MSITIAANYNKQKQVSAGNRDFSAFALYLYGGVVSAAGSSRTPTGFIAVGGTPFATQYGCNTLTRREGTPGTNANTDFRCFTPGDAYNYQPFNLLMTPQERGSLFTQINYDVNDYVTIYGEALYTHTTSGFQIASLPFDAVADDTVISANSIYNPFGYDFGGVSGANPAFRMRMEALGTRRSDVSTNDSLVNAGLRGKLFETDWEWDTNFAFGHKEQEQNIDGYLLKSQLENALGPSFIDATGPHCGTPGAVISGCIPVNIFNPTDPSQVQALSTVSTDYRTNY
jgi:hypothetical protein